MGKKKFGKDKPVTMSLAEFNKRTPSSLNVPTHEELTKADTWSKIKIEETKE